MPMIQMTAAAAATMCSGRILAVGSGAKESERIGLTDVLMAVMPV